MNNERKQNSRRKFLLTAGLGSAGAAVVVAGRAVTNAPGAQAADGEKTRGYHVSEHVLKYYKTTQV
jgi:hypothetical protein